MGVMKFCLGCILLIPWLFCEYYDLPKFDIAYGSFIEVSPYLSLITLISFKTHILLLLLWRSSPYRALAFSYEVP
jgi:hypothetical protein